MLIFHFGLFVFAFVLFCFLVFFFFVVFDFLCLKDFHLFQHRLLTFLNEHLINGLIFCSAIWITLGVLFGMAVIWALLTCITRFVTATLHYNI